MDFDFDFPKITDRYSDRDTQRIMNTVELSSRKPNESPDQLSKYYNTKVKTKKLPIDNCLLVLDKLKMSFDIVNSQYEKLPLASKQLKAKIIKRYWEWAVEQETEFLKIQNFNISSSLYQRYKHASWNDISLNKVDESETLFHK